MGMFPVSVASAFVSRSRAAATVTMRLALLAGVTGGDPTREVALSIHSNLHRLGLARHTLVHVQHLTSILPPTQLPALLLLALLNPPSSTLAAPSARSRVTFSWPAAFLRGLWSPIFLLRNDEGCGRTIRSAAPSVSSHHASCTTRSPEDLPDLSNIVSEEKKENLRDRGSGGVLSVFFYIYKKTLLYTVTVSVNCYNVAHTRHSPIHPPPPPHCVWHSARHLRGKSSSRRSKGMVASAERKCCVGLKRKGRPAFWMASSRSAGKNPTPICGLDGSVLQTCGRHTRRAEVL